MARATSRTSSTDDIAAQLEALKGDVAGLAKALNARARSEANGVVGGIGDLQGQVESLLEALTAQGKDLADEARSRANEGVRAVSSSVEHNPGRALLVAAGLGFVIGLLTKGWR